MNNSCRLCLELLDDSKLVGILSCGHYCHVDCLKANLSISSDDNEISNFSCPLCMRMEEHTSIHRVFDFHVNDNLPDHHLDNLRRMEINQTDLSSNLNLTEENEVLERNVKACVRRHLALKAITREELLKIPAIREGEKDIEKVSKYLSIGFEAIEKLENDITNIERYVIDGDDDPDNLQEQVQEYEKLLKSKEEQLVALESLYEETVNETNQLESTIQKKDNILSQLKESIKKKKRNVEY